MRLFRWAQAEGGLLARYSRDEVTEAVAAEAAGGAALPADLARLCEEHLEPSGGC